MATDFMCLIVVLFMAIFSLVFACSMVYFYQLSCKRFYVS